MAVFNVPNYLEKDGFGMPLNIRRGNPNPLDNSSVWKSLAEAENYAKTSPIAYVGQILTVVSQTSIDELIITTATAYVIDNEAGDLKEVGSSPVGDEKSITVADDGTVSLYGISGLALTRDVEKDGVTVTEKITYQPLLVDGKLAWVEPSTTTVEGLATEIEAIRANYALKSELPKSVSELINDLNFQTETQVKQTVDEAIAEINHAVFKKVDNVPTIDEAISNVLYLVPNESKLDIYAKIDDEMVLIDDTDTDLTDYAKKSELHEHSNKTVLDIITEDNIKAWNEAEQNVIASVDNTQFAIDDNRNLTLLEIAMGKVTGLTDALNEKANKGTTLAEYGIADAYTKAETLDKIAEKITEINGGESAGEVLGQLNSYKETNEARVDTIEEKLKNIAEGAQVNVIESIQINGISQTINDKIVNIPIASATTLGVVKSSTEENKVSINEDGTMEISNININKIIQDEGTTLVLNGGSAIV